MDSARSVLVKTQRLTSSGGTFEEGLTVFDLACGNYRFENYVSARFPDASITYYTVDNCPGLTAHSGALTAETDGLELPLIKHQNLDILELLYRKSPGDLQLKSHDNNLNNTQASGHSLSSLNKHFEAPLCDIAASFGFLHHVPTVEYRRDILLSLVTQTTPGGIVMVSLWQFMKNDALRKKALATNEQALRELQLPPLDENDYILGWQDTPGVYRYCHSFTDDEIDELLVALSDRAQLLTRFTADGRSDDLNTYLVLQVL